MRSGTQMQEYIANILQQSHFKNYLIALAISSKGLVTEWHERSTISYKADHEARRAFLSAARHL